MFGYITIQEPELKIKDYATYRSFYCGLCRSLHRRYGALGQLSLSYDMTFLGLLLTALYEPEDRERTGRCLVHPAQKHPYRDNVCLDYAADMNLLLSYYDLADDWQDERNPLAGARCVLTGGMAKTLRARYPRQAEALAVYLKELAACEKQGEANLDRVAGLTGHMLGEIFVRDPEDVWAPYLRRLGFFLGKFIYLCDAYEDLERDEKKHSYNPWRQFGEAPAVLREHAREVLTMMMSEGSLAFEHLPIVHYEDILRNILYAGVWCRFEAVNLKREKAAAGKEDTPDEL